MSDETKPDAWEQISKMTINQLVTDTKLAGSAFGLLGFTTPEHWPFAIIVAVASTGNEAIIPLIQEFHEKLRSMVSQFARVDRVEWP